MMLNSMRMFCGYSSAQKQWNNIMMCPQWLDIGTAYCTHKTGIILVGSAKPKTARNVSILNFNAQSTIKLPELPEPLQGAGLLCHDNILYVFGGSQCLNVKDLWKPSRNVYSLYVGASSIRQWKTLPPLKHAIEWPIALGIADCICVIGGILKGNCTSKAKGRPTKYRQMYNTNHSTWKIFNDTPVSCDARAAGGFVQDNTIIMYLPNCRLTLDLSRSAAWSIHDYKQYKSVGSKLSPVLFNNKIYSCVYKGKSNTVQSYNSEELWWKCEDICVNQCKNIYYFFVV